MSDTRGIGPSSTAGFGRIGARLPASSSGQRIGLLGGSFNPPHEAHVLISDIARRRLALDRVWWIVTPGNPLKDGRGSAPLDDRVAAARRLVGRRPISVTAFERNLASPYTISTLRYLRRRLPGVHFVWLMGADCMADLHRWRQWQDIMALMPAAVIDRPGWRLKAVAGRAALTLARARLPEVAAAALLRRRPPAWSLLTAPLSEISSTSIRARHRAGGLS